MKSFRILLIMTLLFVNSLLYGFSIGDSSDDSCSEDQQTIVPEDLTAEEEDSETVLCYDQDNIKHEGLDILFVGFFTSVETPIKNISNDILSDVILIKSIDGINFSANDKLEIDGVEKTTEKDCDRAYEDSNLQGEFGQFFNVHGIFDKGFVYKVDQFDQNSTHTIYNYSMFKFDLTKETYDAIYTRNGKRYYAHLAACSSGSNNSTPQTIINGPLDAWDTDSNQDDKIIKTKIVAQNFNLSVGSVFDLGSNNNGWLSWVQNMSSATELTNTFQYKGSAENSIPLARYRLWSFDTNSNITDWQYYYGTPIISFSNITKAYKDVKVEFEYCAILESSSIENISIYDYEYCQNNNIAFSHSYSTDNFAIRPQSFDITDQTTELKAQKGDLFTITAKDAANNQTQAYTVSDADYPLNIIVLKGYLPDGSETTLHGTASVSTYSFTNGYSSDTKATFSDVGKVKLQFQDRNWAAVDNDDTPQDCSGTYICGDTEVTFIPDHFKLTSIKLYNTKDTQNYTYLSNDLTSSAQVVMTITAQNAAGNTTQNFDKDSWEKEITADLTTTTSNTPTIHVDKINNKKVGFVAGSFSIALNETNSDKNLRFNYQRDVNKALNPFKVVPTDLNITVDATYSSETIHAVTDLTSSSGDASFIYAKSYAPSTDIKGSTGDAFIYYEAYCYGTDTNGNNCDKTLLPNGNSSENVDDPRWFINKNHTSANGTAGAITQKRTPSKVTSTTPDGILDDATKGYDKATLTYDATSGYPYKATMQMQSSPWLIYNKFNSSATKNDFKAIFNSDSGDYVGSSETDTYTETKTGKKDRKLTW